MLSCIRWHTCLRTYTIPACTHTHDPCVRVSGPAALLYDDVLPAYTSAMNAYTNWCTTALYPLTLAIHTITFLTRCYAGHPPLLHCAPARGAKGRARRRAHAPSAQSLLLKSPGHQPTPRRGETQSTGFNVSIVNRCSASVALVN
jgi:hypothetical protein